MYLIDEKEIEAVRRVFERRKLFRYQLKGPGECDQFEAAFATTIGASHALLLSSGTNALIAALGALGIGPGDEVIVPSYTFVATATAVLNVGAIPVIAEIDETLGLSPQSIQERITPRTRAIIPVHMDGLACDMQAICELADKNGIAVVEDVAQAIGGSFQGKRLGSWGRFGCFSLNENKIISCGEGGIAVTSDRALYERAFCIHDGSAQFDPPNKDFFRATQPFMGTSMRVSEIQGAIMRVQLERLDPVLSGLRQRKQVLVRAAGRNRIARIITGNCAEGDCGSSLHLLFPDVQTASAAGSALRAGGIPFGPVTWRPAHACWKWFPLLGERASANPKLNPYRMTDKEYIYSPGDYLGSMDILSRTLRMEIDFTATLEDTGTLGNRIQEILDHV